MRRAFHHVAAIFALVCLADFATAEDLASFSDVQLVEETREAVVEQDADAVESGGAKKSRLADYTQFTPAKVDRRLKDGEEVKLGGSTLVARLTAGHTRGCTTWTMKVAGLNAIIIGSPNVNPGYILVNNLDYPNIATDYERTFQFLKEQPIDLFLGAHGSYYDMNAKHARLGINNTNPFIDREGYYRYVEDREQAFRTELAKQKTQ